MGAVGGHDDLQPVPGIILIQAVFDLLLNSLLLVVGGNDQGNGGSYTALSRGARPEGRKGNQCRRVAHVSVKDEEDRGPENGFDNHRKATTSESLIDSIPTSLVKERNSLRRRKNRSPSSTDRTNGVSPALREEEWKPMLMIE